MISICISDMSFALFLIALVQPGDCDNKMSYIYIFHFDQAFTKEDMQIS